MHYKIKYSFMKIASYAHLSCYKLDKSIKIFIRPFHRAAVFL